MRAKKGCTPGADAVADPAETEGENPLEGPEYTPPAVRVRSMVATLHENESLGEILAAAAFARGFDGRGQGVPGRWSRKQLDGPQAVVQRFRGDPGFHPRVVVCFCRSDGGAWVRYGMGGVCALDSLGLAGAVAAVIQELEQRQKELGPPAPRTRRVARGGWWRRG